MLSYWQQLQNIICPFAHKVFPLSSSIALLRARTVCLPACQWTCSADGLKHKHIKKQKHVPPSAAWQTYGESCTIEWMWQADGTQSLQGHHNHRHRYWESVPNHFLPFLQGSRRWSQTWNTASTKGVKLQPIRSWSIHFHPSPIPARQYCNSSITNDNFQEN